MKSKQSILNYENNLLTGSFNVKLKMKMATMMLILLNNHICYFINGCKSKRIL